MNRQQQTTYRQNSSGKLDAIFLYLTLTNLIKNGCCLAWNNQRQRLRPYATFDAIDRYSHHISSIRLDAAIQESDMKDEASATAKEVDAILRGVSDFENWFSKIPGATCDPSIKHADFGNLRGLTYDDSLPGKENWMNIPRSIVLQSDYTQFDWDAKLAQTLWHEIMKGPSRSYVSGYISLLTHGNTWSVRELPKLPPSVAPDALRHWTDEEKSILATNPDGQRLLDLQTQQEHLWKQKFININGMTWEQFHWAMEVVHSRAFCGDFGIGNGSSIPPAVTIATPVIAGLAGYIYNVNFHGENDAVLLGLAALAGISSLVNILKQTTLTAVLLPLIDSANHLEEADSVIEYSSLNDSFTLKGGSKCLVKENNGRRQLYVSYGKKKDTELLVNYGFLRGVSSEGSSSERRRSLAEQFLKDNK